MRGRHDQPCEWPARAVHYHAHQRDQRLTRTALRHDIGMTRQVPSLTDAHDGQRLRWIRRAQHVGEQRRWSLVCAE
jgi:hypothetical protein